MDRNRTPANVTEIGAHEAERIAKHNTDGNALRRLVLRECVGRWALNTDRFDLLLADLCAKQEAEILAQMTSDHELRDFVVLLAMATAMKLKIATDGLILRMCETGWRPNTGETLDAVVAAMLKE